MFPVTAPKRHQDGYGILPSRKDTLLSLGGASDEDEDQEQDEGEGRVDECDT